MQAIGALALNSADVAFFAPPPRRPRKTDGRRRRGRTFAGRILRAVRRELDAGTSPTSSHMPVVTRHYPY